MSNSSELLSGADFEALFRSFDRTAFRLETRESYYERDELAKFISAGPGAIPDDFLADWYELIRSHAAAGREVRRVRVVSEPHSDYTRFGLWLSGRNVAAGEDIRYLPRRDAQALGLPEIDYWLFDDDRLYIVRFADDDTLLGAEPIADRDMLEQARTWRDSAWQKSIPRDTYFAANVPAEVEKSVER